MARSDHGLPRQERLLTVNRGRYATNAVLFTIAVLCLIYTTLAHGATCRYRLWPQMYPFTPDLVTAPNSVCIFPDGRSSLSDATEGGVSIMLYRLDFLTDAATWTPFPFAEQELLLSSLPSNIVLCGTTVPSVQVDYSSGPPVYFDQQPIPGGGHSAVDGVGYPIGGSVFTWAPDGCGSVPLQMYFNSPDINGDLSVNTADVGYFATDIYGSYNYRSDFDFDGVIGLSDLGILAGGIGAICGAR